MNRQKEDNPPPQQGAPELTKGLPFLCVHTSIHFKLNPISSPSPPSPKKTTIITRQGSVTEVLKL